MKISSFTFVIVLLLLTSSYLQATSTDSGYDCNSKCGNRCSATGKQGRCMKYCMMCCQQCKCVPSGNYGNKDECPCYRDWISPVTKRPKCP